LVISQQTQRGFLFKESPFRVLGVKMLKPLKLFFSGFLASAFLIVSLAFIPTNQDAGLQAALWTGATITTTAQSVTTACNQGSGHIGRKTLVVWNGPVASGGRVTVTAELRDDQNSPNFTSGYLAVGNVATNTASSDTALPTEAGGRFCQVTAVSASTSTITVTLRRE
jgi:hypothetical protein